MPKKFLDYVNNNPVIISCCLCGAGTRKEQAPTVPYNPRGAVRSGRRGRSAGAATVHIHVRKDTEVDGKVIVGYKSMAIEKFTEGRSAQPQEVQGGRVDVIINLTTSGGEYEDYKRLQHLEALKPEMCSFDPQTLNWANSYIFEEQPPLPEQAQRGKWSSWTSSPSSRSSTPATSTASTTTARSGTSPSPPTISSS